MSTVNTIAKATKPVVPKIPCPACNKDFLQTTLEKNGGMCGFCIRKQNKPATSPDGKGECTGCEKTFTTRTLKKYGGMCAKCFNPQKTAPKGIVKDQCIGCEKFYLIETLNKNNGKCGHCVLKETRVKKAPTPPAKGRCVQCTNEFLMRTLRKYNGICGKCCNSNLYPNPVKQVVSEAVKVLEVQV